MKEGFGNRFADGVARRAGPNGADPAATPSCRVPLPRSPAARLQRLDTGQFTALQREPSRDAEFAQERQIVADDDQRPSYDSRAVTSLRTDAMSRLFVGSSSSRSWGDGSASIRAASEARKRSPPESVPAC